MKRFFAVVLAFTMLLLLAPAALSADSKVQPSAQKLTLNGAEVKCAAYNIDGYNYVKLRALAELFRNTDGPFDVTYDEKSDTVYITRGKAYSGEAEPANAADESATARPSAQKVVIDDVVRSDLHPWNIGGSNWFKLAELAGAIGFGLSYDLQTNTAAITTIPSTWNAADYAEVYAAVSAARSNLRGGDVFVKATEDTEMPEAASDQSNGGDYSGTNVQVEGVDEGDIIKTDGKYIYVLRGGEELLILKADGAASAVVSRTVIGWSSYDEQKDENSSSYRSEMKHPQEMFVMDGRLCVISYYSNYYSAWQNEKWYSENKDYSCVDIYDVSDPAAPRLLRSLGQDGYVQGTRMLGGKVYLVTSYWVRNIDEDDPTTYVPALYRDGAARIFPADRICICPNCNSTEYVVLGEYDLSSCDCTASRSLLGGGDTLYMDDSSLYVMDSRWSDTVIRSYQESVYTVEEHRNGSETVISRFSLSDDLNLVATTSVPGYMDSQFSADAYDGYFRLVTTRNDSVYRVYKDEKYDFVNYQWGEAQQTTGLYILDSALNEAGKVEDLAPNERVYSARFDGPIAYFCTFRNVDPLFAVDVSDPYAPKVLSALKISGFSEYLHPWGSGRLFGFGMEADEETGSTSGLKLVMFNTEDKTNVTVQNTLRISDCYYSEALYDHKAFFIDGSKNIIGFVGDGDYYVYSYSDGTGFRQLCHFQFDNWPGSVRGFWIGDSAYIVGEHALYVLSLNGWGQQLSMTLDKDY